MCMNILWLKFWNYLDNFLQLALQLTFQKVVEISFIKLKTLGFLFIHGEFLVFKTEFCGNKPDLLFQIVFHVNHNSKYNEKIPTKQLPSQAWTYQMIYIIMKHISRLTSITIFDLWLLISCSLINSLTISTNIHIFLHFVKNDSLRMIW